MRWCRVDSGLSRSSAVRAIIVYWLWAGLVACADSPVESPSAAYSAAQLKTGDHDHAANDDAGSVDVDAGDCGADEDAGTSPAAVCGNSVLEQGEACDDGNIADGDGCSATCQFDDNLCTNGDDRPGYVLCTGFLQNDQVCGPDTICCWYSGTCAPVSEGCQAAPNFGYVVRCDGPEDCPSLCLTTGRYGTFCGVVEQINPSVFPVCHTPNGQTIRCPE